MDCWNLEKKHLSNAIFINSGYQGYAPGSPVQPENPGVFFQKKFPVGSVFSGSGFPRFNREFSGRFQLKSCLITWLCLEVHSQIY